MKLRDLLNTIEYTLVQGSLDTEVTTVCNDSRKVGEGALFFCITGAVFDGHKYAKDVIEKQAAVLITEKEVDTAGNTEVTIIKVKSTICLVLFTFFVLNEHHIIVSDKIGGAKDDS